MGYAVQVSVDKVICRDPETVTTADNFVFATAIATDRDKSAYVSPLRRLRSDEYATYHEVVFSGYSEAPRIVIALRAWDKDSNTWWYTNKADLEKAAGVAAGFVGMLVDEDAGEAVGAFLAKFSFAAIDAAVASDDDDELCNIAHVFSLEDAPIQSQGVQTTQYEFVFSRADPTGYSDWDYSLFVTLKYYQTAPLFAPPPLPEVWAPCTASALGDWEGNWWRSEGAADIKACSIERTPSRIGALNVTITEGATTITTTGVPISKVFVLAGHRELDSPTPLNPAVVPLAHDVRVPEIIRPWRQANTAFLPYIRPADPSLVIEHGGVGRGRLRETIAGPAFGWGGVLLKQQVGPDMLMLSNQAILEMYNLVEGGRITGRALRYMRPVPNVLYREAGAEFTAHLQFKPRVG